MSLEQRSVLVCGHDPDLLDLLCSRLRRLGCRVRPTQCAEQAAVFAANEAFALAVVDGQSSNFGDRSLPDRLAEQPRAVRVIVLVDSAATSPTAASPTAAASTGASPTGASPTGASPTGASPAGASPAGASAAGASPAGASAAVAASIRAPADRDTRLDVGGDYPTSGPAYKRIARLHSWRELEHAVHEAFEAESFPDEAGADQPVFA